MQKKLWTAAFAAVAAVAAAAPAAAQSVDDVLERHFEAMGGASAWKAAQTVQMEGNISLASGMMEGPISISGMRPNKSYTLVTVMGMDVVQAYDGETAWMINPQLGPGPQEADAVTAAGLRDQSDFDGPLVGWEEDGHQVELLGTEMVGETEAHKLQVTLAHGSVSVYYLDAETYLPIKVESVTEGVSSTATMSDYRAAGGLQFPFLIEVEGPMGLTVLTFDSIEVDVELDETIFSMGGGQ